MPYKNIYNEVAGLIGCTSTDKAEFVRNIINEAAKDLYSQSDLVNSLREQLFIKDSQETPQVLQFTLPFYVWKVRAMREYNSGLNIVTHDIRPRYQSQGWAEFIDPLTYRVKYNQVTSKNSLNHGALTISLPDGEAVGADQGFEVNVVGSNTSKTRFIEKLTFVEGDTEKVTSNVFESLEAITKNATTEFDLTISDADGVDISFIPNSELAPNYTLIQVNDYGNWNPMYVEVLYKTKFTPFVNDFDEFPCGPLYDKAIVYKSAETYYITQRKDFQLGGGFHIKCNEIVSNIVQDFENGKDKLIDFGPNQYLNLMPSFQARTPMNPFFRYYNGGRC